MVTFRFDYSEFDDCSPDSIKSIPDQSRVFGPLSISRTPKVGDTRKFRLLLLGCL